MDKIRSQLFSKKGISSVIPPQQLPPQQKYTKRGVSLPEESYEESKDEKEDNFLNVIRPTVEESRRNCVYMRSFSSPYIEILNRNINMIASVNQSDTCEDYNIKLSRSFRSYLNVDEGSVVFPISYTQKIDILENIYISAEWDTPPNKKIKADEEYIMNRFIEICDNTVVNNGQKFFLSNSIWPRNVILKITINTDKIAAGIFKNDTTSIHILGDCVKTHNILLMKDLNLTELGIGGQDEKLEEIFRRAFLTRSIPEHLYEKLGVKHIKGILMYGVPGCGKTLIARKLSKVLKCEEPTIINAPEILGKFIGESEARLRAPFEKAEADPDELHVIIIDEIDAISKQRGGEGSQSSITDSLVNQLLTRMDGVNELNNILVIGMTNRKDLIDEALLRPGRFEIHLEIGLPDEHGRKQILQIHTDTMRKNGILSQDVNIDDIAGKTTNMTGSELTAVVKEAINFSLNEVVDVHKVDSGSQIKNIVVCQNDFLRALEIVKPHFGVNGEKISQILALKNRDPTESFNTTFESLKLSINNIKSNGIHPILIHGVSGKGKTYLSALLSQHLSIPFTKYISANDTITSSEGAKVGRLVKMVHDATKVSDSLLIIDDISILCEWTPPHHFSNRMVQTLKTLLGTVFTGGKMIVILCSLDYEDLDEKRLWDRVVPHNRFELI